jgi:hypothetical protein
LEITASNVASSNGRSSIRASTKLTYSEPVAVAQPRRLRGLLVREVDADDTPRPPDLHGRAEHVRSRAGAEVQHGGAGGERGQVEVVADAGERRQRLGRDRVEQLAGVAQVLGHGAPDLEVELGLLLAGDLPVHLHDLRLELVGVDQRACVSLRQRLGARHLLGPRAHGASFPKSR